MKPVLILLAEDNCGDVLLVQDALALHGIEHDMRVARNGEQALSIVDSMGDPDHPLPDLFLLDLNLPRAEGDVVLQRFREHPGCSEIPVVIMTSSDAPQDHERVTRLGISYYFRKPSDLDEFRRLGEVVKKLVRANRVEKGADGEAITAAS